MLTPHRPPPEDYYQTNCRLLCEFVLERYRGLLSAADAAAVHEFLAVSDDAQRLFARILTRKGPLIRVDSLNYPEVSDASLAIEELESADLIVTDPACAADLLLHAARKDEILELMEEAPAFSRTGPPRKSWRKTELTSSLLSNLADGQIRKLIARRFSVLALREQRVWQDLLLLYFGDTHQDWSAFVIRDLGLVTYEQFSLEERQFESRADYQRMLRYQYLNQLSHRVHEHPAIASELTALLAPVPQERWLKRRRIKTLLRIAQYQEKQGQLEAALSTYALVAQHPARERCVRILSRQGAREQAGRLMEQIEVAPYSEEEALFAERFGRRNRGYQPETRTYDADITSDSKIEQIALQVLAQCNESIAGWHVENSLVRSLTGLVYWPVVFADVSGAFTNPFQTGPNDLFHEDFAEARAIKLSCLEASVSEDSAFVDHLVEVHTHKQGVANSLVNWDVFKDLSLQTVLEVMPVRDIRLLTSFLIRCLPQFRRGLPDLFVLTPDGGYRLIEVKGPGDQLQPMQRLWLQHLERMDIPAHVMRLRPRV